MARDGIDEAGEAAKAAGAARLIDAWRRHGHLAAALDPLGLAAPPGHADLDPARHGLRADDIVALGGELGLGTVTVAVVEARLRALYGGGFAAEIEHMTHVEARDWLRARVEAGPPKRTGRARRALLDMLVRAETLERFMHARFPGSKRYGAAGAEAYIALLRRLVDHAAMQGVTEVVVAPSHRGRWVVMPEVWGKRRAACFAEFAGAPPYPDDLGFAADVPFHLPWSGEVAAGGRTVHVSMSGHPSHLESVNAVTLGRARAKQDRAGEARTILPLLLHTDGSFAAQGVAAETMQLLGLEGYAVGGTVHVVLDNQVAFTTEPHEGRSSPHPTDLAKGVGAPVLHVNGDDPEAAIRAAELAVECRQRFRVPVLVHIVAFRRHGHNEMDEPRFTRPAVQDAIDAHPGVAALYGRRLADDGVIPAPDLAALAGPHWEAFDAALAESRDWRPNAADWLGGTWDGLVPGGSEAARDEPTGVEAGRLRDVGLHVAALPEGFVPEPKAAKVLERRRSMAEGTAAVDWATAELWALGTLASEGVRVRLAGEDAGRGTFSQRHAVLACQATGARHATLAGLGAPAEVIDSPLSEYAAMAYEYGYSIAEPNALVLWEAQFGDFANVAQAVADQYVAAGEEKWLRQSGLVLLLPHGLEGQGPEHCSARPERWLALCARDNMAVVQCSTPANHFHALRRQVRRNYRKPLVALTPKALLRRKDAVSALDEFGPEASFHPVIADPSVERDARRVVLASGRMAWDLIAARDAAGRSDVAVLRLEQLFPFPAAALAEALARHPGAAVAWCQEEPANQGAWAFLDRRIEAAMAAAGLGGRPAYAGRPESPSPAGGAPWEMAAMQEAAIRAALGTG